MWEIYSWWNWKRYYTPAQLKRMKKKMQKSYKKAEKIAKKIDKIAEKDIKEADEMLDSILKNV